MAPMQPLHLCRPSHWLFNSRAFSTTRVWTLRQRPRGRVRQDTTVFNQPRLMLKDDKQSSLPVAGTEPPLAASERPRPPKQQPPLRGAKPFQQQIYCQESLRYLPGSQVPSEVTQLDRRPIAAAERFFLHGCRFLYSAESLYHHVRNDHIPEIVILGASNAGKSSFLNALVGDMGAARVSQRPGRTITMNAYGVGPRPKIARDLVRKGDAPPEHSLILMDTPGYGFKSQAGWGQTVFKYLDVRKMLRGAVLLIPSDKKVGDMDRWMLQALAKANTRTMVVLTKADKCGTGWSAACSSVAEVVRKEMRRVQTAVGGSWKEGSGWSVDVYATAANMDIKKKLGNGGGLGGVRLALLEMAGYSIRERVEKQPETATYSGPIVSFDDIKWKA